MANVSLSASKILADRELVPGCDELRGRIEPSVQQDLFDFWRSLWRDGVMPGRKDIDPAKIPRLLPHIGLIDVLPGPSFRYRLIGTAMVNTFKTDFTGRELFEAKSDDYADVLFDLYRDCTESQVPIYSRSRFLYPDNAVSTFGDSGLDTIRLLLPLSEDKQEVNMLLFSMVAVWTENTANKNLLVIEDSIGFVEKQRIRVAGPENSTLLA